MLSLKAKGRTCNSYNSSYIPFDFSIINIDLYDYLTDEKIRIHLLFIILFSTQKLDISRLVFYKTFLKLIKDIKSILHWN